MTNNCRICEALVFNCVIGCVDEVFFVPYQEEEL